MDYNSWHENMRRQRSVVHIVVWVQCFHISDFLVRRRRHSRRFVDVEYFRFVRLAVHAIDTEHDEKNEAQKHNNCCTDNAYKHQQHRHSLVVFLNIMRYHHCCCPRYMALLSDHTMSFFQRTRSACC